MLIKFYGRNTVVFSMISAYSCQALIISIVTNLQNKQDKRLQLKSRNIAECYLNIIFNFNRKEPSTNRFCGITIKIVF